MLMERAKRQYRMHLRMKVKCEMRGEHEQAAEHEKAAERKWQEVLMHMGRK